MLVCGGVVLLIDMGRLSLKMGSAIPQLGSETMQEQADKAIRALCIQTFTFSPLDWILAASGSRLDFIATAEYYGLEL